MCASGASAGFIGTTSPAATRGTARAAARLSSAYRRFSTRSRIRRSASVLRGSSRDDCSSSFQSRAASSVSDDMAPVSRNAVCERSRSASCRGRRASHGAAGIVFITGSAEK